MKTVVGFFSRPHGFNVLNSLVNSKDYKLIRVYTHKLNPKSQDQLRSIRSDYHLFEELCKKYKIPLVSIDSKNHEFDNFPENDFIIEVSWRYLIPQNIIKKSYVAAFGIHRGKLPEYAGAEPIKQALNNYENEIILSAHDLNAGIDEGKVFETILHSITYNNSISLIDNVQKIRDEITPKFSDLTFKTLLKFDEKTKH
jgi:methionyl-tRNA formyltransferase